MKKFLIAVGLVASTSAQAMNVQGFYTLLNDSERLLYATGFIDGSLPRYSAKCLASREVNADSFVLEMQALAVRSTEEERTNFSVEKLLQQKMDRICK